MKYIGIVVAMNEELEAILHNAKNVKYKEIKNMKFVECKIQGKECVIVESGVGKVNAARTTQILIYEYNISNIINIGVAGAISDDLEIGDVVIAKKIVQHDFDITSFGHIKGYIPKVGNYIEANQNLLFEFENKIKNMEKRQYKIKFGNVATGDIFCTKVEMKNKIFAKFNADVVDMECGAIAQVAFLERKPFIAVRSVSDILNEKNVDLYNENLKLAAKRCADLLEECIG